MKRDKFIAFLKSRGYVKCPSNLSEFGIDKFAKNYTAKAIQVVTINSLGDYEWCVEQGGYGIKYAFELRDLSVARNRLLTDIDLFEKNYKEEKQ